MDECNAPHFPLDGAAAEVIAGALKAPAIGRVRAIQVGWPIQAPWLGSC